MSLNFGMTIKFWIPGVRFGPVCFPSFLLFFCFSLFSCVQTLYLYEKLALILMEAFQIYMSFKKGPQLKSSVWSCMAEN